MVHMNAVSTGLVLQVLHCYTILHIHGSADDCVYMYMYGIHVYYVVCT